MTKEIELLTNPKLRMVNNERIELLEKLGGLKVLQKTKYSTSKQVAEFYGVDSKAIGYIVGTNRSEIVNAGLLKVSQQTLKEGLYHICESTNKKWSTLKKELGISASLTNLYSKQAILTIGFMLEGSPVADRLRKLAVKEDDLFVTELPVITEPVTVINNTSVGTIIVPTSKMPTVVTDYTTQEAEALVVEHAKPVEMAYIPPTEVLTAHKQHNDMSVPVVHEVKHEIVNVVQQKQDELIKTQVNESNEIIVSGRELHEFLEVKSKYLDWFSRMTEYGFVENQDYVTINELAQKKEGSRFVERSIVNHALKLDMAKEISMIQRNEKGKQARQYFIETEKRYKQVQSTPAIPMASYMIDNPIERAKLWIQEEEKRVALVETVETQVKLIEHKDEIIERQVEVIHEKDKAIETLKGEVIKPVNDKYEKAHIMSEGLTPYQMAEAIKHMIEDNCRKEDKHSNWIKLYNSYEGKYDVNLAHRKNIYVEENNLIGMSVIEYVTNDMIHISQLYALAKEMFSYKLDKKRNNKTLSLADL